MTTATLLMVGRRSLGIPWEFMLAAWEMRLVDI